MFEPLLTGPEICDYLRLNPSQLSRMARRDVHPLPAKKIPGMGWRARRADLDTWLDTLEIPA